MHGVISTALIQTRWLDSRAVNATWPRIESTSPLRRFSDNDLPDIAGAAPRNAFSMAAPDDRQHIQKPPKDTRPAKAPVLLMLDEYYAIATPDGFPVVARNMAMFRGYSVKLMTVWQDLAQAETLYQKGFNSFLGNSGVVQAFAPQETLTSNILSEMTGKTTVPVQSSSKSISSAPGSPMGVSVSRSLSENTIGMPLMLEHDIRAMDDGFTLVFSHKAKGAHRVYVPWPGDVRQYRNIMKLDPANN